MCEVNVAYAVLLIFGGAIAGCAFGICISWHWFKPPPPEVLKEMRQYSDDLLWDSEFDKGGDR